MSSTDFKLDHKRRVITRERILISISLVSSSAVLIWAFTMPFRKGNDSLVGMSQAESHVGQVNDLSEQIRERRTRAIRFRDDALSVDQELMRAIREKYEPKPDLPGHADSKEAWARKTEVAKRQLQYLRNVREGEPGWETKQKMLDTIADGPGER